MRDAWIERMPKIEMRVFRYVTKPTLNEVYEECERLGLRLLTVEMGPDKTYRATAEAPSSKR